MKVGFDLDGTLDRPGMCALAKAMILARHEVHIISGCFAEAGDWQSVAAKREKLRRLDIPFHEIDGIMKVIDAPMGTLTAKLHVLVAVDHEKFDRDYRLADLGLRKGAYLAEYGIEVMFDDSELYCKLMPAYCGAVIAHVR